MPLPKSEFWDNSQLGLSLSPSVEGMDFVYDGQTRSEEVSNSADDVGMGHVLADIVVAADKKDARMGATLCLPTLVQGVEVSWVVRQQDIAVTGGVFEMVRVIPALRACRPGRDNRVTRLGQKGKQVVVI